MTGHVPREINKFIIIIITITTTTTNRTAFGKDPCSSFGRAAFLLRRRSSVFQQGPAFGIILQGDVTPPVTTHRNTVTPEQICNKFSFDQYFFLHLYHQSGIKSQWW